MNYPSILPEWNKDTPIWWQGGRMLCGDLMNGYDEWKEERNLSDEPESVHFSWSVHPTYMRKPNYTLMFIRERLFPNSDTEVPITYSTQKHGEGVTAHTMFCDDKKLPLGQRIWTSLSEVRVYPKATKVHALSDWQIHLWFEDGVEGILSIENSMTGWADKKEMVGEKFYNVVLKEDGKTLTWDKINLSTDPLYQRLVAKE